MNKAFFGVANPSRRQRRSWAHSMVARFEQGEIGVLPLAGALETLHIKRDNNDFLRTGDIRQRAKKAGRSALLGASESMEANPEVDRVISLVAQSKIVPGVEAHSRIRREQIARSGFELVEGVNGAAVEHGFAFYGWHLTLDGLYTDESVSEPDLSNIAKPRLSVTLSGTEGKGQDTIHAQFGYSTGTNGTLRVLYITEEPGYEAGSRSGFYNYSDAPADLLEYYEKFMTAAESAIDRV